MDCHECVDVCDWNAIEWTTGPLNKTPKRVKKGIEIFPEPDWQVITFKPRLEPTIAHREIQWGRVVNGILLLGFTVVVTASVLIY
jgi:hypothetical protein